MSGAVIELVPFKVELIPFEDLLSDEEWGLIERGVKGGVIQGDFLMRIARSGALSEWKREYEQKMESLYGVGEAPFGRVDCSREDRRVLSGGTAETNYKDAPRGVLPICGADVGLTFGDNVVTLFNIQLGERKLFNGCSHVPSQGANSQRHRHL